MLNVYVRNISKLAPVSDYEYVVAVNQTEIARGLVRGHRREDGWKALLRRIADQPEEHE